MNRTCVRIQFIVVRSTVVNNLTIMSLFRWVRDCFCLFSSDNSLVGNFIGNIFIYWFMVCVLFNFISSSSLYFILSSWKILSCDYDSCKSKRLPLPAIVRLRNGVANRFNKFDEKQHFVENFLTNMFFKHDNLKL